MPPHILLVGDSADLPALGAMLRGLSADTYGQVYVEVATAIQIRALPAPVNVSVTWLCRDRATSALDVIPRGIGALAHRGELASRAISAWVAEWQPCEPREPAVLSDPDASGTREDYVLWIGCSAGERISDFYRRLQQCLDEPRHP